MRRDAARASLRPQRRFLGSTGAARRPAEAAVAQKEPEVSQGTGSQWSTSSSSPPRRFGGGMAGQGWANGRNSMDTSTSREDSQTQRPNIRKDEAGSGSYDRSSVVKKSIRSPTEEPSRVSSAATLARDEKVNGGSPVQRVTKPALRPRPKDNGWVKTKVESDLTPEEEALRDALKKKAAAEEDNRLYKAAMTSEGPKLRPQEQPTGSPRWRPTAQPSTNTIAMKMKSESANAGSMDPYTQQPPSETTTKHAVRQNFLHSTTRNATLDDHIAQSRASEQGLKIDKWHCADCGFHNFKQNRFCEKCQKADRFTQQGTDAEDETLLAKGWKHVRRPQPVSSPSPVQAQHSTNVSSSPHPQAVAQARAIEQEKTMRLEQTKNGRYVGFGKPQQAREMEPKDATRAFPRSEILNSQAAKQYVHPAGPSESEFAINSTLSTPTPSSNLAASEGENAKRKLPPVLPKDHQEHAESRRTLRSKDGWKRWEPQDQAPYESSLHPEIPALEPTAEKIVTYSPISTAGEQPPQLTRSVERQVQRDLPREPRIARESHVSSSPFISQGNRDRARRSNKQFLSKAEKDDIFDDDEDVLANMRMERKVQRKKAKAAQKAAAPPTPIYLPEFISVSNLAGVLKVRVEDFMYKLKELGFEEMNNDHVLDAEIAGLVAAEFNFEPIIDREEDRDIHLLPPAVDKYLLPARPPVVTIMGHVDHGKTTLLDYLRKSSVAASEHGGITQHIGAFSVSMPGGRLVTFLDTPGHEAFLSMRQRGASVTDIVILVVAADDSVKPQTIEAIKHAQAAKVPMIVAVNKIDKEDSNVEKVKQDLARYGVEIEDYGGDTQVVCVSGKTGQGMEELEDSAVALADILDMRAETDGQAEGWVLEATTKKAGRVATILVRRGTLRPGDVIVAGTSWARVRSLRNEAGVMVPSAAPGTPVEIDGWREQPAAGDEVIQAPDEQKAKSVVHYRLEASERTRLAADMEAVNEARRLEQEKREQLEKAAELAAANPEAPAEANAQEAAPAAAGPNFQEVFFIIKGDVSGSVEAVTNCVSALGNSEVRPHILRSGVGPVTEFDVDHAAVAKGHIINFNTTVEGPIQRMAEAKDVRILDHSIIYRLTDDVKKTLSERLPPIVTQKVLGEAEIGQVFEINTKGRVTIPVAGCRVRNGVVGRTSKIRVLRGKDLVYDGMAQPILRSLRFKTLTSELLGALSSLKNVKKDVTEMRKGNECGMSFENWTSFQVGDQVQTYEEIIEKRTL